MNPNGKVSSKCKIIVTKEGENKLITRQIAQNSGQNDITIIREYKDDDTVHVKLNFKDVTSFQIFKRQHEDQPGLGEPKPQPNSTIQDQPKHGNSQKVKSQPIHSVPKINIQRPSIKK